MSNSTSFKKQFQFLELPSLTLSTFMMILTNNLLPEECRQVWEQAKVLADEVHQTNAAHPLGKRRSPNGIHKGIITPQVVF